MLEYSCLDQCFLTGWMVHLRVNKIFSGMNERRGVGEGWIYFLFSIICILRWHAFVLFFFYPKHINNRELQASFWVFNSQQLHTSEYPYYGPVSCVYYVMGIDFTVRYHALFSLVVESLLCSLHVCPVGLLLCKSYPIESQYFQKFHFQSAVKTRHLNIIEQQPYQSRRRPNQSKYRSSLFVIFACYQFGSDSNI